MSGDAGDEFAGAGLGGVAEDLRGRALLDDDAAFHEDDAIGGGAVEYAGGPGGLGIWK